MQIVSQKKTHLLDNTQFYKKKKKIQNTKKWECLSFFCSFVVKKGQIVRVDKEKYLNSINVSCVFVCARSMHFVLICTCCTGFYLLITSLIFIWGNDNHLRLVKCWLAPVLVHHIYVLGYSGRALYYVSLISKQLKYLLISVFISWPSTLL